MWTPSRLGYAALAAMLLSCSVSSGAATLYVVRRGWHTDVGFAVGELAGRLGAVSADFPDVRYLFFSFGDRRYLMARDHHVPAMLAALWPGRGLILATALRASPDEAFGAAHVVAISVSSAQAAAAQEFIEKSLVADASLPGPYEGSLYFDTRTRYSAVHTCNTWSAEALKAAALPIRTTGVVFASQVWREARRYAESNQTGSRAHRTEPSAAPSYPAP